jgi:hypothetical protein
VVECGGPCSYGIAGNHSFAPAKDSAALANQGLLLVTHLAYYTFLRLVSIEKSHVIFKERISLVTKCLWPPDTVQVQQLQNGEVHHLDVQYLLRYPKVGSERDAGITARGTVRGERDWGWGIWRVAAGCFYDAQVVVKLSIHELSVFALLQGVLSWLAVLCIVVRLTITHSNAVLVAYYESLRLSHWFYQGQTHSQTHSRAGRTRSYAGHLDSCEVAAVFNSHSLAQVRGSIEWRDGHCEAAAEFSIHFLAQAHRSDW